MADAGSTIMGKVATNVRRLPNECRRSDFGEVVAALLKRKYPHRTSKEVAADLTEVGLGEVTIKAAESILLGHLSAKSMTRIALAYGPGFMLEASAEVTGKTLQEYIIAEKERARHEREIWEARERELRSLETAVGRSGAESRRVVRSPGL